MLAKQILLTAVDYSEWAGRRLLTACADLSEDQLHRELPVPHGSILLNVRHTYHVERVWLRRLQSGELPPLIEIGDESLFRDPTPEPDLARTATRWPDVWNGLRSWVEAATEADLARELPCAVPDGSEFRIAQWKLILHNVNHSSLHRGQVMAMLRRVGVQPPGMDIFGYYVDRVG